MGPNAGRMTIAPGKLCRTAISPLPRAAMYGTDEVGSEPMPETWISRSRTARACEAGHARRGLDMHGIEGDAAAFDIEVDGIDGTKGAEERCCHYSFVMDINCVVSGSTFDRDADPSRSGWRDAVLTWNPW
jgi:hypothetical protein